MPLPSTIVQCVKSQNWLSRDSDTFEENIFPFIVHRLLLLYHFKYWGK